ncbi:MAG: RNA polymerase sigma factor, partial [Caulobacteraceae bacterium]
ADDLAQETFLAACSGLSAWRGEASVRTWLCGIAWSKARNARRSLFRGMVRDGAYTERAGLQHPRATGAEERLALANALAELPLEQRAAVALCLAQDFTHAEAAAILRLPLGTVKSHVSRGRTRLLSALGGQP